MFAKKSCRKRLRIMSEPKHGQIGFGNDEKNPKRTWPWVGFLLVAFVSLLMPVSALSLIGRATSEPGRLELLHIPPTVWGVVGHAFALGRARFRPASPHHRISS